MDRGNRRTGKAYRAVLEGVMRASAGENVVVVCDTKRTADNAALSAQSITAPVCHATITTDHGRSIKFVDAGKVEFSYVDLEDGRYHKNHYNGRPVPHFINDNHES